MRLQNRVTPFGDILALPWRGRLMGNRGCLHDGEGRLGARRWRHRTWICCLTEFRGRRREPMPPGRYTALFFPDEAVALAAGHRPCGECRRADYLRFMEAWAAAGMPGGPGRGGPSVADAHLHRHRVTPQRRQVIHTAETADLPDGTFVAANGAGGEAAVLLWAGLGLTLSPEDGRYRSAAPLPDRVTVLTPRPTVAALRSGYRPMVGELPE